VNKGCSGPYPRADAGTAGKRMPQGTDGEQDQPYNRSKGQHHKPVRPRALHTEQVREAPGRYTPEYKDGSVATRG
jgi:hypothetical protein